MKTVKFVVLGSEKFAQAQCIDCVNFLCSNCVVAHQLMHCFNRHRVYPLNEFPRTPAFGFASNLPGNEYLLGSKGGKYDIFGRIVGGSEKPQVACPVHPGERLEFFCTSCDIPVCKDCLVIDHPKNQHEVALIGDVSQREVQGLLQLKERAQAKAEEFAASTGEAHATKIQASYQAAQTAIEDTLQFYVQVHAVGTWT